jgi:Protein of unknown function (DUF3396)
MQWDRFRLIEEGRLVVAPCLEIVAFTARPMSESPDGLLAFYESFRSRFGEGVTFAQTNDQKRPKRAAARDLDRVSFWFTDERSRAETLLGIRLHSGKTASEVQPPAFQFLYHQLRSRLPRGGFRIALPVDFVGEDVTPLLELVNESMQGFPLQWGYSGYSFIWCELDDALNGLALAWIRPFLKRHPGFSCGDIGRFRSAVEKGLANVSWITMVGAEYAQKLGGKEALGAACGEGILIHELPPGGLAVQAGPRPEIGDANRRDFLPLYRRVGEALRPVWVSDDVIGDLVVEGLQEDEKHAWLRRFFGS